jgi:hypothetical protein
VYPVCVSCPSHKRDQNVTQGQLPLALVPTYLVPTFLILRLTALFQARRLGRQTTRYYAEVTDMPGTRLGRPHHPSSVTSKSVNGQLRPNA